jgi:thiol-disulfide isomerase/thioredoxin
MYRADWNRRGLALKTTINRVLILAVILLGLDSKQGLGAGPDQDSGAWRIVNYWSEWCAPCREEIPMLNELNTEMAMSGVPVTVVGVNFEDNPREETMEIAQRMGIGFPTLTSEVVRQLQLKAPSVLPTTYLLSPDNQPVVKLAGAQTRESLLNQLAELKLIDPPGGKVSMMTIPVAGTSSLSRLVTDEDGAVYLTWVSQQGETSVLTYSRLENDHWRTPQEIARGQDWFINWADFPSLVVNEGSMTAHWLRKSAEGAYDYDVRASFFQSGPQEWGEPITIHKDGVSAEHGFVSMLPLTAGRTFISWLDGRNTRGAPDGGAGVTGHESHGTGRAMTLRAGIFDRYGDTVQEWELDARVCDCCQTSSALAATGPIVVYRDRSDIEIRDTYITRLIDGRWTDPVAVHHDGWEISGCPVNGPAVVAREAVVAVAWFSAKDDKPQVKLALSHDNGATFSEPVVVSGEKTIGRIGASFMESGDVAVSWVDADGDSAQLMLARYRADGQLLDRVQVAQMSASRRSGFPVITSVENDVYVTWTDISGDPQVRLARVRF